MSSTHGLQAPPAYGSLASKLTSLYTTLIQAEGRLQDVEEKRCVAAQKFNELDDEMKDLEHEAKTLMERVEAMRPDVTKRLEVAEKMATEFMALEDYIRSLRDKYEQSLKLYKELEAATDNLPPFPRMEDGATSTTKTSYPTPSSVTTVKPTSPPQQIPPPPPATPTQQVPPPPPPPKQVPPPHQPNVAVKRSRDVKTVDDTEEDSSTASRQAARKPRLSKQKSSFLEREDEDDEDEDEDEDDEVQEVQDPDTTTLSSTMSESDVAMFGHHGSVVVQPGPGGEQAKFYSLAVVGPQILNISNRFKSLNRLAAKTLGKSKHGGKFANTVAFKTKYVDWLNCKLHAEDVQLLRDEKFVKSKTCSVCGQGFHMGWDIIFTCATHIAHPMCVMVVQDALRNCNPKELKFYNECPAKYTMSVRGCNPLK